MKNDTTPRRAKWPWVVAIILLCIVTIFSVVTIRFHRLRGDYFVYSHLGITAVRIFAPDHGGFLAATEYVNGANRWTLRPSLLADAIGYFQHSSPASVSERAYFNFHLTEYDHLVQQFDNDVWGLAWRFPEGSLDWYMDAKAVWRDSRLGPIVSAHEVVLKDNAPGIYLLHRGAVLSHDWAAAQHWREAFNKLNEHPNVMTEFREYMERDRIAASAEEMAIREQWREAASILDDSLSSEGTMDVSDAEFLALMEAIFSEPALPAPIFLSLNLYRPRFAFADFHTPRKKWTAQLALEPVWIPESA